MVVRACPKSSGPETLSQPLSSTLSKTGQFDKGLDKGVVLGQVLITVALLVSGLNVLGALQPVNLRCELRINPLGVGTATPRLSWQLQSAGEGTAYRGETQTAYQIWAGSAAGMADLWDSGNIASAETAGTGL